MKSSKLQTPNSGETPSSKVQCEWRLGPLLTAMAGIPFLAGAADPVSVVAFPPLRPAHAEIQLTFWEQYGWLAIISALVVAALAGFILWLQTRPQPAAALPPETQARLALAALPAGAADDATLSQVTQILRRYVRQAFKFPPGEPTTTAFCQMVLKNPLIGPELAGSLHDFFRDSDRRKFSPARPGENPVNAVAQALALIDRCEARLANLRAAVTASPALNPKPA